MRIIHIVGLALAALASSATADTLKVPQDFGTIQAAVDAAAPGDLISVSSGIYNERIVIPPGKDGLTITGKGKVFIDAQPLAAAMDGLPDDGIRVASSGVTLSKLTIRHAPDDGVIVESLEPDGDGLFDVTLEKLTVINCDDEGLDVYATRARILGCTLKGNQGGIAVFGDDALVSKCRVTQDGSRGIRLEGNDGVIENCTVAYIEDNSGISIDGHDGTVRKCVVEVTGDNGVQVDGVSGRVEGCRITACRGDGVNLTGHDGVVTKNQITSVCDRGLELSGDRLRVTSNTIRAVIDDSAGVYVEGDDGLFDRNRVYGCPDTPFEFDTNGAIITRNLAQDFGAETDAGFDIEGSDNIVERNTAKNGDSTGFKLFGWGNRLSKNKASDMTDNGFLIDNLDSADNLLESNTATNNAGDGIQNNGTNNALRGNKMKGNLQDLSNRTLGGANILDDGGNSYSTGGFTSEPIVD